MGCAFAGVKELRERFESGTCTPTDLLAEQMERTARWEPSLKAYVRLDAAGARRGAEEAERRLQQGGAPALCGATLGVKDLYDVQGLPTTGGSGAYGDVPAERDAAVISRARAAGAVVTGKLNTEELAFGVFTEPTRNPFDPERIPGGSSGGSAAALAAGMVTLAVGTDTAGSIRIPAALCGVCGLKPTRGRVPRTGVMYLSYSLDHTGPMARDVGSLRELFSAIAGPDPDDPGSLPAIPPPAAETRRVGVPRGWFERELRSDAFTLFEDALAAIASLGFDIVTFDLPAPEEFLQLQQKIRGPETFHVHEEAIASRRARFGPGVVERILAGNRDSARDHVDVQLSAHRLTRELERRMEDAGLDMLALPTTPIAAPRAGQRETTLGNGLPIGVREALLRYNAPFDVTGWPALSMPCGLDDDGLPRALQLVGRRFEDERLLERAKAVEERLPAVPYPEPPR